eukprot:1183882-Prorocentrum_minimum.AAC.1
MRSTHLPTTQHRLKRVCLFTSVRHGAIGPSTAGGNGRWWKVCEGIRPNAGARRMHPRYPPAVTWSPSLAEPTA